jgi:hypothetical protein
MPQTQPLHVLISYQPMTNKQYTNHLRKDQHIYLDFQSNSK